ncbi:MAG TPA: FAD-dependent oxidoreductase [Bacteroidia bacterium]|jgi:monoamine oxidase|nr:FAD-dependent oxidoreductase [Bacteroidia bacterium]
MAFQNTDKIVIVGAGVSGILTAIALKKRGFTDITLYEKAERITRLTTTFSHDGHQFDLSTKLIPAIGLTHTGVYPPLQELITATGVTLDPTPLPRFFDFEKHKPMQVPACMNGYSKLRIIRDFVKGYSLLLDIGATANLAELYQTDLVRADESIMAWATRHRIKAFGTFTAYLVDLFNMGPSSEVPAGFALISRVHFIAPYLHSLLSRRGIKHLVKFLDQNKNAALRKFLNYPTPLSNYYVIREGYEEFFRRLVSKYDLQVRLNSILSPIQETGKQLTFQVNSMENIVCDKVIFCCPPSAIASLSFLPQVKTLLGGIVQDKTIRTWAFKTQCWDEHTFGKTAYILDGRNHLGLSTPELKMNGELMYLSREAEGSKLVVSPVYIPDRMPEAERLDRMKASLSRFEQDLSEVITSADFRWPLHSSLEHNKAGWNEAFEQLQGKHNMYYSGECFAGIGVPTILDYTNKFLGKHTG